jgi:hypothetical protein
MIEAGPPPPMIVRRRLTMCCCAGFPKPADRIRSGGRDLAEAIRTERQAPSILRTTRASCSIQRMTVHDLKRRMRDLFPDARSGSGWRSP